MSKPIPLLFTLFTTIFFTLINTNVKAQYCIPDYLTGTGEGDYIDRVVLGDIDNTSGAGDDWNDFTALSTIVSPLVSYTLTLYNTPTWPETYEAWIDYDHNGVFDEDESLGHADISAGTSFDMVFTVPVSALPGTTVMRVMCDYSGPDPLDPCALDTYYFGEVEDYSIIIPPSGPYDLASVSINGITTACGLGVTPMDVTIANVGTEPSGDFQIEYQISDPVLGLLTPVIEDYTGPSIPSLGSIDYTFATPADLSNIGNYTIDAWIIYPPDTFSINDSISISFANIPVITDYPYLEDFESGDGGWTSGGLNSSWQLGTPAGATINTPPPPTPLSQNSWTTDLAGYYNIGEQSYVLSPCIDMSSYVLPYLELDVFYDTPTYNDGAKIQYSTDAGDTWQDLGTVGEDGNWYNSYAYSMYPISYTYDAWSGYNSGWLHAHHDVSFLAGESSVKFRIIFSSYSFITPYNDGFAFDNFQLKDPDPNDLQAIATTSPASDCDLGTEAISMDIKNVGIAAQTGFNLSYSVNGGTPITEIYAGTLNPGESASYTFTSAYDFSTPASYILSTWTDLGSDTNLSNDTSSIIVESQPIISTFPYIEDFESGSGGWYSGGLNSSWELGTPAGAYINTPPPTTPSSLNSWTTDLTGYYNAGERSYVVSPCLDFSTLVLPYIDFDLNYNSSEYNDGAMMQYSTDGGSYWSDMGYIGDGGINWYNSYAYDFYPLSFSYQAWSGYGSGWLHAHHDLTFLAGQPSVKFRIIFGTSDFGTPYLDGFAFDNIKIQDPFPNDVGVTDLVSPPSALELTASEVVSVELTNFGTLSQTNFPVSYQLDGGPVYTETYTGTIAPGSTDLFTFAATSDFSTDGIYTLCTWTELAGDDDVTNDTLSPCANVVNLTPVVGTDAYYLYSSLVGYEPGYLLSNSTAMNTVFGDGGWSLDYYESLDPYSIFSENTCFIFMEGSESHTNEMESFLINNRDLVENWVASGGNLFLDASPYEGDGADLGFGGVTLTYPYYTYQSTATDLLHPVLSGPYTPVTADFTGYYVGDATVSGGGIAPIINDYYNASAYLLAEKSWGDGQVMFGTMSAPEYYSPATESQNLRTNIIDYLKLCVPVDLGVTALLSPESGCGKTNDENISVTVQNFGPTDVSFFTLKYSVDGLTPVSEAVLTDIPSGSSIDYTFTATGDFSLAGDHTVQVWSYLTGDSDNSNDTLTTVVTSLATPIIDLGPNMTVCDSVILNALNPGSTYLWSTGATTQTIVVDTSGIYSVTITNPTSGCVVTDNVNVTVNYTPTASFTYTTAGLVSTFTNTSIGGPSSTYAWSFGDGATSSSKDVIHTYGAEGNYTVTLTVTNGCGSAYISQVIQIVTGIEDVLSNATNIYPNPTSGLSIISVNYTSSYDTRFELINELGQTVWSSAPGVITQGQYPIDMSSYSDGVYQLKVTAGSYIYNKQIVLTK